MSLRASRSKVSYVTTNLLGHFGFILAALRHERCSRHAVEVSCVGRTQVEGGADGCPPSLCSPITPYHGPLACRQMRNEGKRLRRGHELVVSNLSCAFPLL